MKTRAISIHLESNQRPNGLQPFALPLSYECRFIIDVL